jgi:hypothetical protein
MFMKHTYIVVVETSRSKGLAGFATRRVEIADFELGNLRLNINFVMGETNFQDKTQNP